jgi:hypothetical protein
MSFSEKDDGVEDKGNEQGFMQVIANNPIDMKKLSNREIDDGNWQDVNANVD